MPQKSPYSKGYESRFKSFGLIFTKFIAGSAALLQSVAEVQVFFGELNEKSAESLNIASFPIDIGLFYELYRQRVMASNSDLKVLDLFEVLKEQVEDIRSLPYGFRKYYKPYNPQKLGEAEMLEGTKSVAEESTKNFVNPSIGMLVVSSHGSNATGVLNDDLLQVFQKSSRESRIPGSGTPNKILRIYVFDNNNSKSPLDWLATNTKDKPLTVSDGDINIIKDSDVRIRRTTEMLNKYSEVVAAPTDIAGENKDRRYNVRFSGTKEFKDFVSSLTSVIQVGGNSSMITSCTVDTKIDKRMAASYMLKAAAATQPAEPKGAQVNGLPAYVIPAGLTINSVGCPLINYMQGFFVDFNTGTTLDNMYYVTSLNHTITPGKFVSSMKLTFNDVSNAYRTPRDLLDILKVTYQATGERA